MGNNRPNLAKTIISSLLLILFLAFVKNIDTIVYRVLGIQQAASIFDSTTKNLRQFDNDAELCENISEIVDCIEKNLLKTSDSMTIRISNSDVSKIEHINEHINSCWGYCNKYYTQTLDTHYSLLKLELAPGEEAYVYDALCNNGDIQQASQRAQKLYHKVKQVLKHNIKSSMSDYEKELAFYNYLINNCSYNEKHAANCHCSDLDSSQKNVDSCHSAYGALIEGDPVCSGYARAMNLLLMCEGIPCKTVYGTGHNEKHNWNLVQLDQKWYQLDVTWDDSSGGNYYYYFNITDDIMAWSHSWDKSIYPAATGKKYNYYRLHNRYFTKKKTFKNSLYQTMVKSGKHTYKAFLDGFLLRSKDIDEVFKNTSKFSSVRWKTVRDGKYTVVKITGK